MLGVILLGNGVVYADYTEYLKIRIPQNIPNVCIFEAEEVGVNFHERDFYNKTVNWIQEGWIDNLNNYTNSNNWDMTFEYIPNATHYDAQVEDFPQCHIMIVWDEKNEKSFAQGFTGFDHRSSKHKFAYIDVFTSSPAKTINLGILTLGNYTQNEKGEYEIPLTEITLEYEPISDEAIRIIVQHEFGHALGLGHYFQTLENNYSSIMPTSVEFKSSDEYLNTIQITEDDLEAVVQIYGKDGLKSYVDPPVPKYAYGWNESVLKTNELTGEFIVKFPDLIWLDPNYNKK